MEDPVELGELDDEALEREARREALRDRRQARAIRKANAEMDLRQRALSLGVLVLGTIAASVVVIAGLLAGSDGLASSGLLAFGAISGAALYQRYLALREARHDRDEADSHK